MFAALLLSLAPQPCPAQPQDPTSAEEQVRDSIPVGVPRWSREVVLDGSLLQVRPPDLETALIVRIDSASPHGTAWRYDLEYYGLEPGSYDLVDFLRREDGSGVVELAPFTVIIESHLPPGQIKPHPVSSGETPELGGYSTLCWALGFLWLLGTGIWLFNSRRRAVLERERSDAPPPSLAELLAPLVERGIAGDLPVQEQAQLELMLIAIWRKRLDLEDTGAASALETLKAHPEAGPLLRELERWLHSPEAASDLEPAELLLPYRDLSAREWDEAARRLASEQTVE